MSEDIVERLRFRAKKQLAATPTSLLLSAADRIEELEAKNLKLFRKAALAEEWRDHDRQRAVEAETKLEEAIEESIIKGMHIALITPIEQVPEAIASALTTIKCGFEQNKDRPKRDS